MWLQLERPNHAYREADVWTEIGKLYNVTDDIAITPFSFVVMHNN